MAIYWANPEDPDEDPAALLFYSAQFSSIPGMQKAIDKDPKIIYASDIYDRRSALHFAAASVDTDAVNAVRWLLEKGIPWSALDSGRQLPEDIASNYGNDGLCKFLREWAVKKEYELFYKLELGESHPDEGKPFTIQRLDKNCRNEIFCKSTVLFINPNGTREDEVALVCDPSGDGIMMEWERPIMHETARLLLEGMPTSGLRILNIGFGIGMIDTYFQDAQPEEHVIIEGHPTCLSWMRRTGWYDRPGVRILEGRWQDFFDNNTGLVPHALSPSERKSNADSAGPVDIGKFDVVYFDTFQEGYSGHFSFIRHVPRLLRGPSSRFSYFNGHATKHETVYKIYAEVARLHHNDLGMNTAWSEVYTNKEDMWNNIRERGKGQVQEHPHLIPICMLAPTLPRTLVRGVGWNSHSNRDMMGKQLGQERSVGSG